MKLAPLHVSVYRCVLLCSAARHAAPPFVVSVLYSRRIALSSSAISTAACLICSQSSFKISAVISITSNGRFSSTATEPTISANSLAFSSIS
ncbi:hypothetical protein EUBVEN_00486 [Eubacterium ventriosum ATCC 27560]|uniref:Secreted protein n=1 Tax=Eubacterium ventriosum ATCC 27560 TaxID=411463 RepID=A5Z480_9FIRM|nr:hypothetical protein EUBVEN_00486 [Eubacterium ventriosum ATCC 27560]